MSAAPLLLITRVMAQPVVLVLVVWPGVATVEVVLAMVVPVAKVIATYQVDLFMGRLRSRWILAVVVVIIPVVVQGVQVAEQFA